MTNMSSSTNKKALIITGLHEKSHRLFPTITNRKREELIVLNSFGAVISQPYGCMIRTIIMAVYNENVEEIYIVGERSSQEHSVKEEELLSRIQDVGISKGMIETIEYINVVGNDVLNWLVGPPDVKIIIQKNIDLIQRHPLIPKTVSVYGFIANTETNEFEAVS